MKHMIKIFWVLVMSFVTNVQAAQENYLGILMIEDEEENATYPIPTLAQLDYRSPNQITGRLVLLVEDDLEIDDYIQRKDSGENAVKFKTCKHDAMTKLITCGFSGLVDEDPVSGQFQFTMNAKGSTLLGHWRENESAKEYPMYFATFPQHTWIEERADVSNRWMKSLHGIYTGTARASKKSASRPALFGLFADDKGNISGHMLVSQKKSQSVYSLTNCKQKKKYAIACQRTDAEGIQETFELVFNKRINSFKGRAKSDGKVFNWRGVKVKMLD